MKRKKELKERDRKSDCCGVNLAISSYFGADSNSIG